MAEKSLILLQQENLELRKENEALKETIEKFLKAPNLPVPTNNPPITADSAEEQIIEEQVRALQAFSAQRMLTLEEVRALDLLIKNKNVIQSKKPLEPDWRDVSEKTPEAELLRLAGDVPVESIRSKSKTSKKDPVD